MGFKINKVNKYGEDRMKYKDGIQNSCGIANGNRGSDNNMVSGINKKQSAEEQVISAQ